MFLNTSSVIPTIVVVFPHPTMMLSISKANTDTKRFGVVDCCVICRSTGCECPLRLLRTDFSKGSSCHQVARSIVTRSFVLIAFCTPKRAANVDCVRFDGRQITAISIVLTMVLTATTTPATVMMRAGAALVLIL